MEGKRYRDREEAGRILAALLVGRMERPCLLLAIPNGGAAVAAPMAEALGCDLRLLVVRKLQVPWNPEAGFGALGSDGSLVLDQELIRHLGLGKEEIQRQKERAWASIQHRMERFGDWARWSGLRGRTVILVDDGLATGSTMEAAVRLVRSHSPSRLLVAVPTSSRRAYRRVRPLVDDLICPDISRLPVFAVADAYERWSDLSDEEVLERLGRLTCKSM